MDDARSVRRTPIASSVHTYFYKKYGLKKIAEEYLYALVAAIKVHKSDNKRIETFGALCGIVHEGSYSPYLCDVILEALGLVFPASQIRTRLDHSTGSKHCYVDLLKCKSAVQKIFPRPEDGLRLRKYTEMGLTKQSERINRTRSPIRQLEYSTQKRACDEISSKNSRS